MYSFKKIRVAILNYYYRFKCVALFSILILFLFYKLHQQNTIWYVLNMNHILI